MMNLGIPPLSWESGTFCGSDMAEMPATFQDKTAPWDSLQMLAKVTRDNIRFDPDFVRELEPVLWNDLTSEFDAENFCEHLKNLECVGQLCRSNNFLAFEKVWRRDEFNHTLGFARIFSTVYGLSEEELFYNLRSRSADFNPISKFMRDEFAICVVIAYDEIATTRLYKEDHSSLYPTFGNPNVVEWMRLVARDEAMHFNNILSVIKANHPHRIPEVPALLDALVHWDTQSGEYKGTFVLNHQGNQFSPDFLESCRAIILRRLGLA